MKIVCGGNQLADATLKVTKALPSKVINPVMECIKLTAKNNFITLYATDKEISIEIKINADVLIEGEVIIPGKLFADYMRKLNNEDSIELNLNGNQLVIKYGDSKGTISCLDASQYPIEKEQESISNFSIKSNLLKKVIEQTIFAVSTDDSRPILKGCLFEIEKGKLTTVALDGYRIAKVSNNVDCNENTKIIIPARGLSEVTKLINDSEDEIKVNIEKQNIIFNNGNVKFTTRLIEGEYINYKQIIPVDFMTKIIVNKNQLTDALDRASIISRSDKNNMVKMEIKEKNLNIRSNSELGDINENVTVSIEGKDILIAFNVKYISECLRVIDEEFCKISFTSNVGPAVITQCEDDNCLFLILPVRLLN